MRRFPLRSLLHRTAAILWVLACLSTAARAAALAVHSRSSGTKYWSQKNSWQGLPGGCTYPDLDCRAGDSFMVYLDSGASMIFDVNSAPATPVTLLSLSIAAGNSLTWATGGNQNMLVNGTGLSVASGGVLTISTGASVANGTSSLSVANGTLSNAGAITIDSQGTATAGNSQRVSLNMTAGSSNSGSITVTNHATNSAGNVNTSLAMDGGAIANTGAITVDNAATGTGSSDARLLLGGSGALTLANSGTISVNRTSAAAGHTSGIALAGDVTISGTGSLNLAGGTYVAKASSAPAGTTPTLTLASTLNSNGAQIGDGNINLAIGGAGVLNVNASTNISTSSAVSNAGSVSVGSGNTLTVTQAFNNSGALTVNGTLNAAGYTLGGTLGGAGTLAQSGGITSVSNAVNAGSLKYALNGGTLSVGSAGSLTVGALTQAGGAIVNNGTISAGGFGITSASGTGFLNQTGGSSTLSGNLGNQSFTLGGGTLTVAAGNTLTLGGRFTGSAGTLSNAGALQAGNGFAFVGTAVSGAGTLEQTGGTSVLAGNFGSQSFRLDGGTVTVNSGASLAFGGSFAQTGGTLSNSGTVQANGFVLNGGAQTGSGLLRQGAGATTVSGNYASAGGFQIDGGTASIAGGKTLSLSGNYTQNGGSTLVQGTLQANQILIHGGTLSGQGTLASDLTLDGGSMGVSGGTTTVTGDVLLTGTGNLNVGATGTLSAGGSFTLNSGAMANDGSLVVGGTFAYSGGSYTGSGTISAGGADITVPFSGNLTASGGTIRNSSSVAVAAGQTFQADSYVQTAGNTQLNNGVLAANTIINGGSLSGNGIIDGDLTVGPAGTYTPGNSPGTQTITGDFVSSGRLVIDIDSMASFDRIFVGGNAFLDGTVLDVNLNFVPALYSSFQIVSLTGSGSVFGKFVPGAFSGLPVSTSWLIRYNPSDVMLELVPEPQTYLLFALGLIALGSIGRYRRRKTTGASSGEADRNKSEAQSADFVTLHR